MTEEPFTKLSAEAWELRRQGYVTTVQAIGNGTLRVQVHNPGGDLVDESTFAGASHPFREARWMLASAIETGE